MLGIYFHVAPEMVMPVVSGSALAVPLKNTRRLQFRLVPTIITFVHFAMLGDITKYSVLEQGHEVHARDIKCILYSFQTYESDVNFV